MTASCCLPSAPCDFPAQPALSAPLPLPAAELAADPAILLSFQAQPFFSLQICFVLLCSSASVTSSLKYIHFCRSSVKWFHWHSSIEGLFVGSTFNILWGGHLFSYSEVPKILTSFLKILSHWSGHRQWFKIAVTKLLKQMFKPSEGKSSKLVSPRSCC